MSTTHKRVVTVEILVVENCWRVSLVADGVPIRWAKDAEVSNEAAHEAANCCAESLGPLWKPEGEGT